MRTAHGWPRCRVGPKVTMGIFLRCRAGCGSAYTGERREDSICQELGRTFRMMVGNSVARVEGSQLIWLCQGIMNQRTRKCKSDREVVVVIDYGLFPT